MNHPAPLTLDEWRRIATQTLITITELRSLCNLINGHVQRREQSDVVSMIRKLTFVRYRIEVEMFEQTGSSDTSIFDPEQERKP